MSAARDLSQRFSQTTLNTSSKRFRKYLTAFDAIHPRRKQRRIVAWSRKKIL
jgi:hypothetical protein